MLTAHDLARASRACVHFTPEPLAAPAREALSGRGVALTAIDAGDVRSEADLLAAIAAALEFPDYFGGNWDALDECLRDLSWLSAKGVLLEVRGAGLWRAAPEAAGRLIAVWLDAAESWAERAIPLHLVFVVEPGLASSGPGALT